MSKIQSYFPTLIYRADQAASPRLNQQLDQACRRLAQTDAAGLRWSEKHGYSGYTSFASLSDLTTRHRAFKSLERILDRHATAFVKALHWNIKGGKPVCDSLWVNVMAEGGAHTSHIHTNAVLSGTYYVAVPQGAGAIVYEDPRHAMMMAAPSRSLNAPIAYQSHVSLRPETTSLLLWESWLRHEVPVNRADGQRISISFNYVIGEK